MNHLVAGGIPTLYTLALLLWGLAVTRRALPRATQYLTPIGPVQVKASMWGVARPAAAVLVLAAGGFWFGELLPPYLSQVWFPIDAAGLGLALAGAGVVLSVPAIRGHLTVAALTRIPAPPRPPVEKFEEPGQE